MCFSEEAPPFFNRSNDDYEKWKRKFSVWRTVTEKPAAKHGGLLILHLDDATQDEVLEQIDASEVKKKKGVKKVLSILDKMCKKDESMSDYEIYVNFESFTRPASQSVSNYCDEFDRLYRKVKNIGTHISDHVLALKLLQSANLCETDLRIVKACVSEITYDEMVKQLKKSFIGDITNSSHSQSNTDGKQEESNTIYGGNFRNFRKWKNRKWYPPPPPTSNQKELRNSPQLKSVTNHPNKKSKGSHPSNNQGEIQRCEICESINHIDAECPDQQGYHSPNQKGFKANNQRNLHDENITYEVRYLQMESNGQTSSKINDVILCSPENKNSFSVENNSKMNHHFSSEPDFKYNKFYNRKNSNLSYQREHYHRPKCYNCHLFGHISLYCPEENNGRKCFICKLPGHMAKYCKYNYKRTFNSNNLIESTYHCNSSDIVENSVYYKAMCYICGEKNHTARECTEFLGHKSDVTSILLQKQKERTPDC